MQKAERLDATERAIEYIENKRKQAGLMQKQLADLGGISHSYYTKLVGLKRFRERYGDENKGMTAPLTEDTLERVLQTLSDRLGEDCVSEGMRIWRRHHPDNEPEAVRDQSQKQIGGLIYRLLSLSPEKLKTVEELIDHLQ